MFFFRRFSYGISRTTRFTAKTSFVLLIYIFVQPPCAAHTKKHHKHRDHEEVNPIAVIQGMINKGKLEQAKKLLNSLEGDRSVIESFQGIIAVKTGHLEEAVRHFKLVLKLKPNQTAIWLYLGQCYFKLHRYKETLDALEHGYNIGKKLPSYFLMKSRTQQELGMLEQAYETLETAYKAFPKEHTLLREQALLLVRAGLYAAALKKGSLYLDREPKDRYGYLVLGEALRQAGRTKEAQAILEKAALSFDHDPEVVARLALAYSGDGRNIVAARLFEKAFLLGGDYAYAAAECYRLAGKYHHALRLNAFVTKIGKRLHQRLAIYLGAERFIRAASLIELFRKSGVMDDTARFRLAYALMRVGDLNQAEQLCTKIKDPSLVDSADKLRQAISKQRNESIDSSSTVRPRYPGSPTS